MTYDAGTGTRGYQFDGSSGTAAAGIAIGNGSNYRAATKFTSQSFTSGYTLLPTAATVRLKNAGTLLVRIIYAFGECLMIQL